MKWFLRGTGLILGLAFLAFVGIWLFRVYTDSRSVKEAEYKAKLSRAEDSTEFYRKAAERDSVEYRTVTVPRYIRVRDSAIRDTKTPESTRTAFKACDLVLSACDSAQGKLRGQIRALEYQNDLLEHKPGPARVVGYGDVLYDAIGLRPVVRVGGNMKVLGPFVVRVEGEYAIPSSMRKVGDGFRVLVGARVNFNR